MNRIGIYAGTFDPIHNGHISFALQAIKEASLGEVYFLIEPKPRYKTNVSSFKMRTDMLNLAIKPYPKLKLLELKSDSFSVSETLPQLSAKFANTQLVFLFGSDVFRHIPKWAAADEFARAGEFIVSIRGSQNSEIINETASKLQLKTTVLHSQHPDVSSQKIRQKAHNAKQPNDTPIEVANYIKKHRVYS